MTAPTPLIAVAELAQLRLSDRPPVVLDVRWRLDEPDGLPAFRESHLPDAVYVSLDDELARHGDPGEGRHPLPDPGAFQASTRAGLPRFELDGDRIKVNPLATWAAMPAPMVPSPITPTDLISLVMPESSHPPPGRRRPVVGRRTTGGRRP